MMQPPQKNCSLWRRAKSHGALFDTLHATNNPAFVLLAVFFVTDMIATDERCPGVETRTDGVGIARLVAIEILTTIS
jgi:hypothetical protein